MSAHRLFELLISDLLKLISLTHLHQLVLLFVAVVNQSIHLLDNTSKLLLLGTQLARKPRETQHHIIKLLILLFLFIKSTSIKDAELVLEFSLDVHFAGARLVLLLSVDGDKIAELGSLFALTNLDDDAHHDVFKAILAEGLLVSHVLNLLGQTHHVVTREFSFLLEDFVLVDKNISTKWLLFILLNELFHLVVAEAEDFSISLASQVDIHLILHEESAMVDG